MQGAQIDADKKKEPIQKSPIWFGSLARSRAWRERLEVGLEEEALPKLAHGLGAAAADGSGGVAVV